MAWSEIIRRPWAGWTVCADLLYPPRCLLCGREPAARPPARAAAVPLCDTCTSDLQADTGRCLRCGGGHRGGACRPLPACDGIVVLGGYADRIRDAVLRCKRPAGDGLARALAALLVDVHGATLREWRIDRVAAVPMHWRRRFVRGTSAADELATAVAARLHRPHRRLLVRRLATRMQNELPVADRPANVAAAFALRRSAAGGRVLLVDDVCTTGATLSACARTLKAAGAAAVYAVAVARAEPGRGDAELERRGESDE